jgi:hypothetical protein
MTVLNYLLYLALFGLMDLLIPAPVPTGRGFAIAGVLIVVVELSRWWAVRCERARITRSIEALKTALQRRDQNERI